MNKYLQIILIMSFVFITGDSFAQSRTTPEQSRLASRQPKRDNSAFLRKLETLHQKSAQDKQKRQRQVEADRIKDQQKN